MRSARPLLGFSALAAVTIVAAAPGALAQPEPGALTQPEPVAQAATAGVVTSGAIPEALAAGDYWTPARMASARSVDVVVPGRPQPAGAIALASPGAPVSVPPALPAGRSAATVEAPEAQGQPIALAAASVPRPYTNYPDKVNGKVFFTKATGGDFVCSGTAVNSTNKSVVWTAGHCVHNGSGGAFHRNWIFVPAYSSSFNGHRPFGTWTARQLSTRTEWAVNGNFRQDFGAATVNRINNVRLVDSIGGDGISFNLSRNQSWAAFGYPQAAPFNGFDQFRCNSGRLADDFPAGAGPATIKINCNMTGGSSGGGWLINIQPSGLGFVNGLNSYRYGNTPNNLFGPYHGNEGLSLFNTAQAQPA